MGNKPNLILMVAAALGVAFGVYGMTLGRSVPQPAANHVPAAAFDREGAPGPLDRQLEEGRAQVETPAAPREPQVSGGVAKVPVTTEAADRSRRRSEPRGSSV